MIFFTGTFSEKIPNCSFSHSGGLKAAHINDPRMKSVLTARAFALWLLLPAAVSAQPSLRTDSIPGSGVSFPMVLVPTGVFPMRSSDGTLEKQVRVDSFWIGQQEVKYDEFIIFYQREYDSDASTRPDKAYAADAVTRPTPQYIDYTYGMGKTGFPAVSMTQQAALRYCRWLYDKTGVFYRLPTEAEWEYACRAGQESAAADALETYAWFFDNAFERYQAGGQKQPNAWGLYDMLGNVAEWTLDEYQDTYLEQLDGSPADNPWLIPQRRHSRTVRGGSYDSPRDQCTCTFREKSNPRWQARDPQIPKSLWWNPDAPFVGFRIVRPVAQPDPAAVDDFFRRAIKD